MKGDLRTMVSPLRSRRLTMKRFLAITAIGLMLAGALGVAQAQQGTQMMNQTGQGMMQGQGTMQGPGMMMGQGQGQGMGMGYGAGNMMGLHNGTMGPGMMNGGMMMGGMMGKMHGPEMMIVMMDTNGDGQLQLEEFQAVHNRMFNYLDENGDGQLTVDELRQR
ncbi:MAG TPA: histidine kinase [Thalassospira sp.]|nr:histidine kinase [Thalassospira sp.]